MEDATKPKTFDHNKANVSDKIALISEFEHGRSHALRSAVSLYNSDDKDNNKWLHYAVLASQFQTLRRKYQTKHFPDLTEFDWCLCKLASRIRQLAYENFSGDVAELKEIDDLVDSVWGTALDMDLSDCVACKGDKASV